jgi:ribosomal protein L37AE/L43A
MHDDPYEGTCPECHGPAVASLVTGELTCRRCGVCFGRLASAQAALAKQARQAPREGRRGRLMAHEMATIDGEAYRELPAVFCPLCQGDELVALEGPGLVGLKCTSCGVRFERAGASPRRATVLVQVAHRLAQEMWDAGCHRAPVAAVRALERAEIELGALEASERAEIAHAVRLAIRAFQRDEDRHSGGRPCPQLGFDLGADLGPDLAGACKPVGRGLDALFAPLPTDSDARVLEGTHQTTREMLGDFALECAAIAARVHGDGPAPFEGRRVLVVRETRVGTRATIHGGDPCVFSEPEDIAVCAVRVVSEAPHPRSFALAVADLARAGVEVRGCDCLAGSDATQGPAPETLNGRGAIKNEASAEGVGAACAERIEAPTKTAEKNPAKGQSEGSQRRTQNERREKRERVGKGPGNGTRGRGERGGRD